MPCCGDGPRSLIVMIPKSTIYNDAPLGSSYDLDGDTQSIADVAATVPHRAHDRSHDSVDAPAWVDWFKWVTAAYIISRGIAKASRVLER